MLPSTSKNKKKFAMAGVLPVAFLVGAALLAAPGAMAARTNAPNVDYTFAVNSGGDSHDATPGNHICADSIGACTLRAAIEEAFSSPNLTTINVSVPTVTLSGSLGTINWAASDTRVNGNLATVTGVNMSGTQDIISISGNNNTLDDIVIQRSRQDGVRIGDFSGVGAGNNNTLSNAVIVGNARFGVYISGGSGGGGQNNRVTGTNVGITRSATSCVAADANPYGIFVTAGAHGTQVDNNNVACSVVDGISVTGSGTLTTTVDQNRVGVRGNVAVGNGFDGVTTYGGATNTNISRNIISGNAEYGVYVSDATTQNVAIGNNVIGLSTDGSTNVPNAQGVVLRNTTSQIVTTNTIKGNTGPGVRISGGSGNSLFTNQINGNGTYGVQLEAGTVSNAVGGSLAGYGNTISGNGTAAISSGVYIAGSSTTGNFVYGNKIGTTADGAAIYRNTGSGVELTDGAHDNRIGSLSSPNQRNILSGNIGAGVHIHAGANSNRIEGNYIGTDAVGTYALNNEGGGIYLGDVSDTAITSNLVSGNGDPSFVGYGIQAQNAPRTIIRGNLVGTNAAGNTAIPNTGSGITLGYGCAGSIISGPGTGQANTVSGNTQAGIYLYHTDQVVIDQATFVGVALDHVAPLGNSTEGIRVDGSTNTIVRADKVNNNDGAGVALIGDNTTLNNSLLPTEVRNNGGLPVDLNNDGPTNNDPGDFDSGPNTLLNYPVITGSSGSNLFGTTCAGCEVYIYEATGNPRASGGGGVLRFRTLADGTGDWSASLPSGLNRYNVTLVACDGFCQGSPGSTSEMSPVELGAGTPSATPVIATQTPGGPTATPRGSTATPTACLIQFADVPSSNTFYPYARCLVCKGILSGYPCGGTNPEGGAAEPCDSTNKPYFRYNNAITRGQISKIVSNAAGFNEAAGSRLFEDVPESSPFYAFVNRLVNRNVMSGYTCGSRTDEPCIAPANRPYFRPQTNASRGQLSKIVSNAAGFSEAHTEQTFQDVDTASPFYAFIQRLVSRTVMSGYPCGGAGEACVPPANRGYFRPNSTVTRGQAAKIVANALLPNCQVPARP